MAIFRGVGGSGDSSDNSFLDAVTAQANAASASATSAANSLAAIQETEVTSASFDTSDGVLTLTKTGGATVTADLDGRFLTTHQDISGKADTSGATFTGDVLFNDGVKAKFGTDSDLAIYHTDGGNSVIEETGEGALVLQTNGSAFAVLSDANDYMINATVDGGVSLYNDGNLRFSVGNTIASIALGVNFSVDTDTLYVDSTNDRVGINDSLPSEALDVNGNIAVSGTVDGRDVATDGTKLDGIETGADVTDTANVTSAGALMDSEVTNLAQVKAFDSSDYATSTQGTTADNALPKAGGQMTGNITFSGTQTVDGRDLSVDGSKLDSIKKRTFGNTSPISITTTSPVTIFEGGIAAPNVDALQTMTARFHLRVANSSTSNSINNQYYLTKFLYSKGTAGVSLGTATYVSSPSPYNAWYYVSGDKTDIIVPNRGRIATSSAGASSGQVLGSYYDSTNDRTYFRITKFPDATTVYNNVTVYYSVDGFVSSGSYVANNNNFNSRYFSLLAKELSTNTHQSPDIAIEDSFGRSSTATKFKIEIDFITLLSNLVVTVYDFMGHTEVSP
jgi:hypothetical protein